MEKYLSQETVIKFLKDRYAVKQFEKRDIDTTELENIIKSILQLTPTSFGLQAYKFLIIKDKEKREKLKQYSWGQTSVVDSDLYLVFCVPTDFNRKHIENHVSNIQKIRGIDDEKKAGVISFMEDKIITNPDELGISNHEERLTRQAYIALGNLMTSLSILGIDNCPIEGLDPKQYNEILGLKEKKLTTKVAIAIGKRSADDKYQFEKKVRFGQDELFIEI